MKHQRNPLRLGARLLPLLCATALAGCAGHGDDLDEPLLDDAEELSVDDPHELAEDQMANVPSATFEVPADFRDVTIEHDLDDSSCRQGQRHDHPVRKPDAPPREPGFRVSESPDEIAQRGLAEAEQDEIDWASLAPRSADRATRDQQQRFARQADRERLDPEARATLKAEYFAP